jgi:hypothetical protein
MLTREETSWSPELARERLWEVMPLLDAGAHLLRVTGTRLRASARAAAGRELVAFRDTEGRIGLLDEFCPTAGSRSGSAAMRSLAWLCLSRLEVRRGWHLCRPDERASDYSFAHKVRTQPTPPSNSVGSSWPIWAARENATAAGVRVDADAGDAPPCRK